LESLYRHGEPPKQRGAHNPRISDYRVAGYRFQRYGKAVEVRIYNMAKQSATTIDFEPSSTNRREGNRIFLTSTMSVEKHQDTIAPTQSSTESVDISKVDVENDGEIFKRREGIEDFRTVSWIHTSVIFLKRKAAPPFSLPIYAHRTNYNV
jgi:hypothetical protein